LQYCSCGDAFTSGTSSQTVGACEVTILFYASPPRLLSKLSDLSAHLIEDFLDKMGSELAADPDDVDDVINKVHTWSDRKRSQMKDGHVRAA